MFMNRRTDLRRATLAGLSLLALSAGAANAQVQGSSPAEDPETAQQTSEVVVFAPLRDSQTAALHEQRLADNLVNVIASDTVGRFPDQN